MTLDLSYHAWQEEASCRGDHRHHFYPPTSHERRDDRDRRERQAKALCALCPVRVECLDHALEANEVFGIWGGMNELERRHLKARRYSSRYRFD